MAVQAAHVATMLAAHTGTPAAWWATQTIALCTATPAELHDLIVAAGGTPWLAGTRSSHDDVSAWFVEPDLYWEPTAFAQWMTAGNGQPATPVLADAALWTLDHAGRARRWPARELGRRLDRLSDPGRDIWEFARTLHGATETTYVPYDARRRAAHLLATGKEPPMT